MSTMKREALCESAAPETAENTPRRVLFVCTGNTCRSPMAAAVLNDLALRRAGGLVAASAGLFANDGAPITPAALRALRAADIAPVAENDYTAHTAHTVSAADIAWADTVVAMTDAHVMQLMLRFPEAVGKLTVLPMQISDPYGGSDEVYAKCLAELQYCIELAFFAEGTV